MARVLIIDDDELVRAALALLLQRGGHETLEVGDGYDARRFIDAYSPDLIITDILMPNMDGFELIREVRKEVPDLKVIAISAGAPIGGQKVPDLASRLGADCALSKPIDQQDFLSSVNRLLEVAGP